MLLTPIDWISALFQILAAFC